MRASASGVSPVLLLPAIRLTSEPAGEILRGPNRAVRALCFICDSYGHMRKCCEKHCRAREMQFCPEPHSRASTGFSCNSHSLPERIAAPCAQEFRNPPSVAAVVRKFLFFRHFHGRARCFVVYYPCR